jgi:hypothetical protein
MMIIMEEAGFDNKEQGQMGQNENHGTPKADASGSVPPAGAPDATTSETDNSVKVCQIPVISTPISPSSS